VIDAILKEDKTRPVKQRHTAKRIFELLKAEYRFSSGYTIVKDYVRGEQLRKREMFVPLVHPIIALWSVSGRDDRSFSPTPASKDPLPGTTAGRPCAGLGVLRGCAQALSLRQQQDRGGADIGRRGAEEDESLPGSVFWRAKGQSKTLFLESIMMRKIVSIATHP
jgi:hypothetical protein